MELLCYRVCSGGVGRMIFCDLRPMMSEDYVRGTSWTVVTIADCHMAICNLSWKSRAGDVGTPQ